MYIVRMGKNLLHDAKIKELQLFSPKLTHEINKAGSFTFTIYPQHPYIGALEKMKSVITIEDSDGIIWRGRLLNSTQGFYNQLDCSCEGEMAFLNDSTVRPYEFQGTVPEYFAFLIEQHNVQVEEEKRFLIGNVTVMADGKRYRYSGTEYPNTLEELQKSLLEQYGGYIWFRHENEGVYIDYLQDSSYLCNQAIEFKKNLLDLSQLVKGQDIATVLIPLGAKGKENGTDSYVTIESVNEGKDYIEDEEAAAKYGRIVKTVCWDDETEPIKLLQKARAYMRDIINLLVTITFSAVDLSLLNRNMEGFRLFRYVPVVSSPHGLKKNFLIQKIELDLSNPLESKLTAGSSYKTFTDKKVESDYRYGEIAERFDSIVSDYELNKTQVTEQINDLKNTFRVELAANYGVYQVMRNGIYNPDYTESPLVITPTAYFKGEKTDDFTVTWKRRANGAETDLLPGESIAGKNLTVSENIANPSVRYICYAEYRDDTALRTSNAHMDFVAVRDGMDGASAYVHTRYSNDGGKTFTEPVELYDRSLLQSGFINSSSGRVVESETYPDSVFISVVLPEGKTIRTDYKYIQFRYRVYRAGDGSYIGNAEMGEDASFTNNYGTEVKVCILFYHGLGESEREYVKIRYADEFDAGPGEVPGSWIGQYSDHFPEASADPSVYTWVRAKGDMGLQGRDAAVISAVEPEDKTRLWCDISSDPPYLKRWNGEEWDVVNDNAQQIVQIYQELISKIQQASDSVMIQVGEKIYEKAEVDQLLGGINTEYIQTKDAFEYKFNTFMQDLADVSLSADSRFLDIQKYIRFADGEIILGVEGNPLTCCIKNDRISFLEDNVEVSYISNKRMYITDMEVINSIIIGNFALLPRRNGNLSLRKIR